MAQPLTSPAWYRVAELRPRLRSHARIRRHEYRGERWYVLEDRISRRTHRCNPAAWFIIGLMDGRRSLQQIWDAAVERLGDEAPKQEDVMQLLGQLHLADVLQVEVTPDVDELLRRSHRAAGRGRLAKWMSPLAIRFPLFDPDRLLERWLPWFRPLFGPAGAVLWLAVVGWAAFTMVQHWDEFSRDITHRVLAPENLLILWLVFPLIKAAHEFGHACAVKAWGGEVHEMGIMLLVLMPVPYVDASAANAFPQRYKRVLVGAAGMLVELFIASIALYLWLEMQPGIPRAILFNVMVIAGVSTVLFNANPLLRFDGYYILADLIEMPNLRQRATQYVGDLVQRRLLGVQLPAPSVTLSERAWFTFFAIASFIYRIVVMFGIAIFIAREYFIIGVVLAIWTAITALVLPLGGLVYFLASSPRLRRNRLRATIVTGGVCAVLLVLVFLVPVPSWTNAQGVVWVPEQAEVRSGTDGFIKRVIVQPGARVQRGDPLIESEDPSLTARVRSLEAQRAELGARYQEALSDKQVRAQVLQEQMKSVDADLERARERARELIMRSPVDGIFAASAPQDLPGRFVKQGQPLGYVIPGATLTARVVVTQQSVDLVRGHTERVLVKLAEQISDTIPARILREVPGASDRLPSLALSQAGGGEFAVDAAPGGTVRALQTHFEFEIELPSARAAGLGARVYVRFEHGNETIAVQSWRSLRQLFLRALTV
jgi:putative peptide zinc metalloprotease protein